MKNVLDIPWTSAGSYLKQGWNIEKLHKKGGEFMVTLRMPYNASKRPQDARKGRKGSQG